MANGDDFSNWDWMQGIGDGSDVPPEDFSIPYSPPPYLGNAAYSPGDVSGSPAATPGTDWTKNIGNLLALLTLGGGGAGLIQNLFSKGPTTTTTPQISPQATAQIGQSGNILQQLLSAMASPQIPAGLSSLVEQAYQPAMGDIASQAIMSARNRGFAGGAELLNTGPGGAIAGPALSNLQGQMAGSKLNLYQNNISNLLAALQGSNQLAGSMPFGSQTRAPAPTLLQSMGAVGPALQGAAQIFQAANPPPQPDWGSLLKVLRG